MNQSQLKPVMLGAACTVALYLAWGIIANSARVPAHARDALKAACVLAAALVYVGVVARASLRAQGQWARETASVAAAYVLLTSILLYIVGAAKGGAAHPKDEAVRVLWGVPWALVVYCSLASAAALLAPIVGGVARILRRS